MSRLCLVVIDGLPSKKTNPDFDGKIRAEKFLTMQFKDAIIKYYSILEYEWYVPGIWGLGQQADKILQDLVEDENLGLATDTSPNCRAIVFISHGLGGCLVKQILLLSATSSRYRVVSSLTKTLFLDEYCSAMNVPLEENIKTPYKHTELWTFTEENHAMNHLVRIITAMMVVEPRNLYDQFQLFLGKISNRLAGTIAHSWTQHTFHTDSMSWVKDNSSFIQWRQSVDNVVLHVDGKPGSGIALLSSYILNFLKVEPAFTDSVLLKFTATAFGPSSLQSTVILLTLSHQILAQRPALFQRVSWLCSWLLNDPGVTFTKPIAYSLLSTLLNSLDEPIFCIIENFHLIAKSSECEQLLIDMAAIKKSTSPIRILVTTELHVGAHAQEAINNDHGTIVQFSTLGKQGVAYLPLHLQSEQAMFTFIEELAQSGIMHLTQEKPCWAEFKDDILEKICIDGTTQLLAMHQIDLLRSSVPPTTRASLRHTLKHLPLTLEDIYNQALPLPLPLSLPSASDEAKKDKWAQSALCWIAFAFRPLEVREAAIALAFDNENIKTIDMMKENIWNDVVGDLSAIIGPLLRVVGNHLYLVHHTIRALPGLARESKAFHLKALLVCLRYLRIVLEDDHSDTIEPKDGSKMSFEKPECELLRYSSVYWPDHFRIAFSEEPSHSQYIDEEQRSKAIDDTYKFLTCKQLLNGWSKVYKILLTPAVVGSEPVDLFDTTCFATACRFGLLPIMEKYVSNDSNCISDIEKRNALDTAARFGHADIVKWLLSMGASSPRAIYLASIGGHVDVIEELIQNGFSVHSVDSDGYTPFLHTAKLGHLKAMCCLLQNGASAAETSQDGSTALHFASRIGHLSAIKELADRSDYTSVDKEGYTALHRAATGGFFEVVSHLYPRYKKIQKAACVTNNGDTTLHLAAASGSFMTCQFLLEEGAAVLIIMRNEQRKTPLHIAAECGYLDIVRCILKTIDGRSDLRDGTGPKISAPSDDSAASSGEVFLEEISPSQLAAQNGHLAVMSELLDRQARLLKQKFTTAPSLWSSLDDAYLCLRDAAGSGHADIVEKLLSASVGVSRPGDQGDTPLKLAAKFGHSEVVEKISVLASRDDQAAALLLASKIGDAVIVRILIRGDTPIIKDDDGKSPVHLAVESGNIPVFQELLEAEQARTIFQDEQEDLITIAAEHGHSYFINHVFNGRYISVGAVARDRIFWRLMKSTIVWKSVRMVETLLANGLSWGMRDAKGYQPLHIAAKYGNAKTIGLLVEAGGAIEGRTCSGSTPLLIAIQAKNILACESLLERKADPNTTDEADRTPLSLACKLDEERFVELLLRYGADISATNPSGQTVLHTSVSSPEIMNVLLKSDPGKDHADAPDGRHRTPLILAAELGISKTVEYLLAANVNPNHADEGGYTSLHLAARGGHLEIIKILVDKGAGCNKKTNSGQLPLHMAAAIGHCDVLEYLLPFTEDINTIDNIFGTPLAAAGRSVSQYNERIRCSDLLLRKEAQVNCYGGELHSPLQTAAWYENLGLVQLLLDNGAEVNAVGGYFRSALHAAIEAKQLRIMTLLLEHDADTNIEYGNRSALEHAIYGGDVFVVKTLLNGTTDPSHLISSKGQIALRMAAKMDKLELVKLMLEKGASVKSDPLEIPLLSAIISSYSNRVLNYFLRDGQEYIDINEQDRDGQTALDYTILGEFGSVNELLDAGMDPNIQDKHGNTALIHALKIGSDAIGDILAYEDRECRKIVRSNVIDNIGRGPLYWACYYGQEGCFSHVMLKLSALQSTGTENQECYFASAIHAAAAKNRSNMLRRLIEHGVDVNQSDRNNWTPLHTAQAYRFEEIQRILEVQLSQDTTVFRTGREDISLRRPLGWNKLDMHRALEVSEDGLMILLQDQFVEDKFGKAYIRTARADYCIPDNEGVFYFEIRVKLEGSENSTSDLEIGVGFSEEHVSLDHMVGWQSGSWGFHGDDGALYEQRETGTKFNQGYGSKDTIGCGIDFSKNVGFFTRNGRYIGQMSSTIRGKLYPTVSFGRNIPNGTCLETNFGNDPNQKFRYDVKKHDEAVRKHDEVVMDNVRKGKRRLVRSTES